MRKSTILLGAVAGAGLATAALAQSTPQISGQMTQSGFMLENGLIIPSFDAARGRELFASKGCVLCHAINGIGGEDAPDISGDIMDSGMNAFEFAARMWLGAPAMIAMQEMEMGEQIALTGEELAAIIAFVHDTEEQARFSEADIPENIMEILEGEHGEDEEDEDHKEGEEGDDKG